MTTFLKEHIHDELQDCLTYAKKAVEVKESNHEASKTFWKLSNSEKSHATFLIKILMKTDPNIDSKEIIDEYINTIKERDALCKLW